MKKKTKRKHMSKSVPKVKHKKVLKKTTKPSEEIISEKGKDVLHIVEKGIHIGAKAITSGAKIAGRFTGQVARGAGTKVQILRLSHQFKSLYTEIGTIVCYLDSKGQRKSVFKHTQIKRLINKVRDVETKIDKLKASES